MPALASAPYSGVLDGRARDDARRVEGLAVAARASIDRGRAPRISFTNLVPSPLSHGEPAAAVRSASRPPALRMIALLCWWRRRGRDRSQVLGLWRL